jgi:hypothetical protein
MIYTTNKKPLLAIIEEIAEIISDSDIEMLDMPIRALILLLENVENDANLIK